MIADSSLRLRLAFLSRVIRKECRHLAHTDRRLFEKLCLEGFQAGLAHVHCDLPI